ncbi:MAG TPA: glycosyltransferase [Steroidobacteraceae bacterium]
MTRTIRMLYWTREEFPTFRVDIDVLFGRELLRRGHVIDFVMQAATTEIRPGEHPWHGRTVYVGATAIGPKFSAFLRHWRAFRHDLRCLGLARSGRYDAIQFRDKFLIAALGVLVARARGLKFFYWLSFPYPEADRLHARDGDTRFPFLANARGIVTGWLLYKYILPRCDHAFVQSARMQQDIAAHGIPPGRMTPIPMGIDLDNLPAFRSRARKGNEVILGYLGALNADRRIDMLIDMLAELHKGNYPVRLLLVGDAYERADRRALQERACRLGVEQYLEITGALPRLEALQRMQDVDIALSPIFPTPMFMAASPTKLVEYFALGLPVVANEHPEQRTILATSNAGVCTPWGARHFARAVRWLLRQGPEMRAAMGVRGRNWVEQHRTYRHLADDLELKYLELFDSPRVALEQSSTHLPLG